MDTLRNNYKLIDIFYSLVSIPSPSLKESIVADKILSLFKEYNISAEKDGYGNVKAYIPPTASDKKPLLISAHMDVVGDNSPVNIKLNGEFIETDKSRTLGADDKAGVAAAILLASQLASDKSLKHGGLEIIFTRDEEQNMTGIHNVNFQDINAEHVLVLDADKLGQVQIAGASYTKLIIEVTAFKGGHSGIDIDDSDRLNAAKLIAELVNVIPQGVYKKDDYGVVTSINLGVIAGGGIQTAINHIKEENVPEKDYVNLMLEKAVTNVINTNAGAAYSIRSSSRQFEKNLIEEIKSFIDNFNKKYLNLASAQMHCEEHLPQFEKSNDETLINAAKNAAQSLNLNIDISSFHAGAETHVYANNKNKYGKTFKPVLIGLADIYNMHSRDEKINYISYLKGFDFLKEFFIKFNNLT